MLVRRQAQGTVRTALVASLLLLRLQGQFHCVGGCSMHPHIQYLQHTSTWHSVIGISFQARNLLVCLFEFFSFHVKTYTTGWQRQCLTHSTRDVETGQKRTIRSHFG